MKKNHAVTVGSDAVTDSEAYTNSGLTLFVRKNAGMTGFLKAHEGLLTLLEGPYPTNPTKAVLQSDRLLLIGGGIGITGPEWLRRGTFYSKNTCPQGSEYEYSAIDLY
jgi:hypothetical protein